MKPTELTTQIEKSLETLVVKTGEAKHSEQFTEYLEFASHFHSYSLGNIILIHYQRPNATYVAGYRAWQKMNRFVRKGEKGIAILAPCIYRDKEDETKTRIYFKTVYVFDISQTEGEPIPEINWRTTEQNVLLQASLTAFVEANGWKVKYQDNLDGAEGICRYGAKTISLLKGTGTDSLIHEIGHMLLHENQPDMSREEKETEAESVSFVVSTHFGLETKAPVYLSSWTEPKQIKEHADRIIQVAHKIIEYVEPSTVELDE